MRDELLIPRSQTDAPAGLVPGYGGGVNRSLHEVSFSAAWKLLESDGDDATALLALR